MVDRDVVYRDTDPPELPSRGHASSGYVKSPLADPLGRFGLDLLAREAKSADGNVVLSPASIHAALAMTLNGASGETATEMRRAMAIDSLDAQQTNQAWADVIASAHSAQGAQIRIADSLWVRQGITPLPQFGDVNFDYFAAGSDTMSEDPREAAVQIDRWVEERTGGRIKDLLSEVPPIDKLVLVNAIYVKAAWDHFETAATQDEPFTLTDGEKVDVPMMHGDADAATVTDEYDAALLDTNGPVGLWVIVPKGSQTPESVIAVLQKRGLGSLEKSADDSATVHLAMPRFRLEYTARGIVDDLKDMGMQRAFSVDQADFSRMAEVKPLWIDDIAHKAILNVDEGGLEAAAATAVVMAAGAAPPTKAIEVRADRPFVCVLTQTNTDVPLFMAIVRDPR